MIFQPYICIVIESKVTISSFVKTYAIFIMALAQNPMTGQMSGTVGNIVTSKRAKQNLVRSKAFKPRNANSEQQQKQRGGFKLIVDEYQSWGGVIELGFTEVPEGQTPYTLFMAANLPGAIDKSGVEPVIDYSKLAVSDGSLPAMIVTEVSIVAEGISISYKTPLRVPRVNETDEVVAIAKTYTGEILIDTKERGAETVGTILIDYPGIQASDVQCCYLYARSADTSKASKSVFIRLTALHPQI